MIDSETPLRIARAADDTAIAAIVRSVMSSFGAQGPGYSINDPEVDCMSAAYATPRSAYYVLEAGGQVIGGSGIAPLAGGDFNTCELRKMYFLPHARGRGLGAVMLQRCLDTARGFGFARCYLETLATMTGAIRLYERFGFTRSCAPLGATGHNSCDRWYILEL